MPVTPTYPGVYIEEISSGVRTITGVSTSVAAFVDQFRSGPVNEPVQLFGFGDFEREFGGLDSSSEASYAIQQFFLNGGGEAWAVRVVRAEGNDDERARKASLTIANQVGGTAALRVDAISEGIWGNRLRARIDWQSLANGETQRRFNLTATEYDADGRTIVRQEVFRNLLPDDSARLVVNDPVMGSKLVRIAIEAAGTPPAANGTLSGKIVGDDLPTTIDAKVAVAITDTDPSKPDTATARIVWNKSARPTLLEVAEALQAGIRAARPDLPTFGGTTVRAIDDDQLWILPGGRSASRRITFDHADADSTAEFLQLATGEKTLPTTISGALGTPIIVQPTQTMHIVIDDPENMTLVTINGPEWLTEATEIPLEQVPPLLETAIQKAGISQAFKQATVTLVEDKLHVRSGDARFPAPTFANNGDDLTATNWKLVGEEVVYRTITISGIHQFPPKLTGQHKVAITIGSADPVEATIDFPDSPTLEDIANALQTTIQGIAEDEGTTVSALETGSLMIIPGASDTAITVDNIDDVTAGTLKLAGIQPNIAEYQLGVGSVEDSAQIAGAPDPLGFDGGEITTNDLIGSPAAKTGIFALEKVDLFNILCIPRFGKLAGTEATMLANSAIAYCERRRAFYLVDTPEGIADQRDLKAWLATSGLSVSANAAIYYPRLKVADPLADFRLRSLGASGTMAGIYARTDAARGVWKAPAGTETNLRNVNQLEDVLTDAENGALNPLGINCLRTFPVFGNIAWGARTLQGADQQASEWKYIPVRRLALFLEESLYRGTKWVVFEPNDEPLWAQIRLNIGAFMQNLFRQGAFQGGSPREAYFVKCDKETTTQADINLGIVNIVVGFAPLKPAEFVIIKFQQMAGQLQV